MSDDLYGQAVKLVRNISAYAGLPGSGPSDKKCKHCAYFIRHECSKTYFKCGFGRVTSGSATDIKANAPSCLHFKEPVRSAADEYERAVAIEAAERMQG